MSEKLDAQFAATTKTLEAEPTLDTLQSLQQDWQRRELEAKGSLSALTLQATKLQEALNQLSDLQKTWSNTRASAQEAKAPDPILQQIDATLAAITAAQAKLQSERAALLDLQSRVAQEVTKCDTVLAQIEPDSAESRCGDFRAQCAADLERGSMAGCAQNPSRSMCAGSAAPIGRRSLSTYASRARAAVYTPRSLSSWPCCSLRRGASSLLSEKSGAAASSVISVFERPYAAALATTLIFVTSPFFQMPTVVRQLLTILMLVPMLRVARPMLSASVASVSYTFCFLLAVDILRQAFSGIRLIGLAIIVAETLAAIIVLFGMRRHYRQIIAERAESSGLIVLKLGRFLAHHRSACRAIGGSGRICAPGAAIDAGYSCRRRPGNRGVHDAASGRWS